MDIALARLISVILAELVLLKLLTDVLFTLDLIYRQLKLFVYNSTLMHRPVLMLQYLVISLYVKRFPWYVLLKFSESLLILGLSHVMI